MKKNGDYNNIEEILQKRYEGVKKDIKDPGFVNINYAGAQRKERFYEKPAVYAAGLVLVAVLVCGGTFIGLKYLEKLGASRIDPLTSDTVGISGELTDPDVTDTEQVTDDDCGTDKLRAPVYMTVKSGGETIYPNAYFLWSEKYSDADGAWIDADGAGAETVKAVPDIAFDGVSLEIGYENASEVHYSIKQYGKALPFEGGDLSGFFSEAEQGVYRVIASFTVTGREIDGKFESSAWECPFDVAVWTTEVTVMETEPDSDNVSETETETDTETETTAETTVPDEPKDPDLIVRVSSGAVTINPDAYAAYGGGVDEDPAYMSNKVPDITYVNDGLKVEYDEKYVTNVVYGIDLWSRIYDLDGLNTHLKKAAEGVYRVIIRIERETHDGYGNTIKSTYDYPFDVIVISADTETVTDSGNETEPFDTTETYPPEEFIDLIEIRANGEKINGLIPEWETFTGYELEIVGREDILIYYKTGMTVSAINKASIVSVESTVRVQGGYNDPVSHNSLDSLNAAITKALQDGADSIYITVDAKNSSAYAHYSFEIMFGQKGKAPVYLSVAGDGRIYPDAYPDHVDVYENGNKAKTVGNGLSDAKNIPTVNYGEGLSVNYSTLTDKYLPQRLIKYTLYDINTGKTLAEGPKIGNINAYLESANSGIYRAVVSFYLNDFNMNDGTTVTGYYVYPFNVYVEYKETSDAKRPVYLTVSNGNGTIYPDGYFCWSEMYDDKTGSWVDGCNGLAPEYVSAIEFDGELNLRYENAGNGTEIEGIGCYDESGKPIQPSMGSLSDLNRFFKTADKGVYRVYVTFIVKGRLIDGKYERECWEYPFDVVVK